MEVMFIVTLPTDELWHFQVFNIQNFLAGENLSTRSLFVFHNQTYATLVEYWK